MQVTFLRLCGCSYATLRGKHNMTNKTLLAALSACLFGFTASAYATNDTPHPAYALREASAPGNIKSILAAERQQIAASKHGYTVGFTSLTGMDIKVRLGYKEPASAKTEASSF